MHNIKLIVAYDGTSYLGWQKTKMGPSIEEALEHVLTRILQHPVQLQAASRTDAGVHATAQVVNFFTPSSVNLSKLEYGLNGLLPKDIAIRHLEEMPEHFHPTLDCKSKEYHYYLNYGKVQLPPKRLYTWHYPEKLSLEAMRNASLFLVGTHDFSAFCNTKENATYSHHIRTVESITLKELPNQTLRFEIKGDHFLYKMVRNIVGTLAYVGCEKILQNDVEKILESHDRTKAGITAPAHGLFLHQVYY
jgi:tRNA pseudouridine38-40 synthase